MSRIEEVIKAILGEGEITSDLISRLEKIFEAIYEDKMYKGYTLSRSEIIVCCILEGKRYDGPTIGRIEQILKAIANDGHYDGPVISRVEELLIKWFTEYHKVVEFTGEFPATIRSTGNDIVNYRIYGNTIQDGEPSPDNPVDVVGCGVGTENLFDKDKLSSRVGYYNSQGEWRDSSNYYTSDFIFAQEGEYTYIANGENSGYYTLLFWRDTTVFSKPLRQEYLNGAVKFSFTLPSDGYITISYQHVFISGIILIKGTTPPDHYIPYGYKLPIVTSGVNLFDTSTMSWAKKIDEKNQSYELTVTNEPTNGQKVFLTKGSYTLSLIKSLSPSASYAACTMVIYNADGNMARSMAFGIADNDVPLTKSTTILADGVYILSLQCYSNSPTYNGTIVRNVMFTRGTTPPTQYEPYHPPISTDIYLGSEPLHKIGNYADYVDFERGVVVRNVKKLVLTGEENWARCNGDIVYYDFRLPKSGLNDCDFFSTIGFRNNNPYRHHNTICFWVGTIRIAFDGEIDETLDSFKSYLADQYAQGTPVTVWYVLQTPEEETPPVPFPKIPTFDGTTILDVSEDLYPRPSKVELEYYGDLYMTADNKLYRMPNGEFLGG